MQKVSTGGLTIDKLLQTAEAFKGFKKHPSILKQLDGKYRKEGLGLKKEGKTTTALVKDIRETY